MGQNVKSFMKSYTSFGQRTRTGNRILSSILISLSASWLWPVGPFDPFGPFGPLAFANGVYTCNPCLIKQCSVILPHPLWGHDAPKIRMWVQTLPGELSCIPTASFVQLPETNDSATVSFQKGHPANPPKAAKFYDASMNSERIWKTLTTLLSLIVYNATGKWMQLIFHPRNEKNTENLWSQSSIVYLYVYIYI